MASGISFIGVSTASANSNANLSSLSSYSGGPSTTPIPNFTPNTTTYSLATSNSSLMFLSSTEVMGLSKVRRCNGTVIANDNTSCNFVSGANTYTVTVTAADLTTTKTYTITITYTPPVAPVITSSSTITAGEVNPTIVIQSTIDFTCPYSFCYLIGSGTTGLVIGAFSGLNTGTLTVQLTGTASAGTLTFKIDTIPNSNTLSFVIGSGSSSSSSSSGLTPLFSSGSSLDGRYTVQVSNYDSAYTYAVTSTAGQASINSTGLVTVTGLSKDQSVSVTVTTTRTGYSSASGSVSGRSQVAAMTPSNKPTVTLSDTLITCTIGSYSATPTSSAFSLFVDGKHVSTIFSALGDYLPDWIIPWATSSTITRTASLTSATWAMSDAYKGKSITCATLAYSKNAIGFTASQVMVPR